MTFDRPLCATLLKVTSKFSIHREYRVYDPYSRNFIGVKEATEIFCRSIVDPERARTGVDRREKQEYDRLWRYDLQLFWHLERLVSIVENDKEEI